MENKTLRAEFLFGIANEKMIGYYLHLLAIDNSELRRWELAVYGECRCPVLELTVFCPLEPDQAFVEKGEAIIRSLDNSLGVRLWMSLEYRFAHFQDSERMKSSRRDLESVEPRTDYAAHHDRLAYWLDGYCDITGLEKKVNQVHC